MMSVLSLWNWRMGSKNTVAIWNSDIYLATVATRSCKKLSGAKEKKDKTKLQLENWIGRFQEKGEKIVLSKTCVNMNKSDVQFEGGEIKNSTNGVKVCYWQI